MNSHSRSMEENSEKNMERNVNYRISSEGDLIYLFGRNVLVSQFEVADGTAKGLTQNDEEELIGF